MPLIRNMEKGRQVESGCVQNMREERAALSPRMFCKIPLYVQVSLRLSVHIREGMIVIVCACTCRHYCAYVCIYAQARSHLCVHMRAGMIALIRAGMIALIRAGMIVSMWAYKCRHDRFFMCAYTRRHDRAHSCIYMQA
jgi:hypothetical protein